jgi:Tol biopolymer transport system component
MTCQEFLPAKESPLFAGKAVPHARFFLLLATAAPAANGQSVGEPTGDIIAFHSSDGGNPQIYIMNADGSGRTQLTDDAASNVAPEISPDGSHIVFASDRDGTDHIYLMSIDGRDQHRLTDSPGAEGEPTWSPSGTRIYFRKETTDGRIVIGSIKADGSDYRQLTDGSIRYLRAKVAPDGERILAVSVTRGFELYVMNVDGSDQRKMPNISEGVAFASWSPEGTKIVYAIATPPPSPSADIYVINADGTGQQRLTKQAGVNEYPAWSPDGREIAFQTSRDGNFEIYVMNADGTDARRLTNHPGMDGRPSWGRSDDASASTRAHPGKPSASTNSNSNTSRLATDSVGLPPHRSSPGAPSIP